MARSYQSVLDLPDPLTGTASAWGDWGSPQGFDSALDWAPSDQYAYGYTPSSGYSFDPVPQGDPYGATSTEFGFNIADSGIDQWLKSNYPELYSGFTWGTSTNPGVISSPDDETWKPVNQWNDAILAAVHKVQKETGVYVPPNVVKALMKIESQGNPQAGPAYGLLQITGDTMGQYDVNLARSDPAYGIWAGVNELALRYQDAQRINKDYGWGNAAVGYFSGHYEPTGAADQFNTDQQYLEAFNKNMAELANAAGTGTATGDTKQFNAIWGGYDAPVTQEFGWTEFAQNSDYANSGAYDYTKDYTRDGKPMGHAGIDVGLSYGSALYAPAGGTVTAAGGTGFYCDADANGCGPGVGQLNITLANGDVIVLGHMSQIGLKVGDTVTPGQFVGYSGSENGPHVHVEYRKWVGEGVTASGYEVQDPRLALQGIFQGTYGQAGTGPTQAASATGDWGSFMAAAAKGNPLTGKTPSTGGFHDWLLTAMGKKAPTMATGSNKPVAWTWDNYQVTPQGGAPAQQ